jgi:hypothetical protein
MDKHKAARDHIMPLGAAIMLNVKQCSHWLSVKVFILVMRILYQIFFVVKNFVFSLLSYAYIIR